MQYPLSDEAASDCRENEDKEYRNVNDSNGRRTCGCAAGTNLEFGRLIGEVSEPEICDPAGENECRDSECQAAET